MCLNFPGKLMHLLFLLCLADAAADPVVAEFSAQDGSLSVAGRDFLKLPKGLGARFGADTHLLDASYNLLSCVRFSDSLALARDATFACCGICANPHLAFAQIS